MRQVHKVFIVNLNGISQGATAKTKRPALIKHTRILLLRAFIMLLKILGFKQSSISEVPERSFGKFYCPVFDIHDLQSLSEFNQIRSLLRRATVFIAPAFMSAMKPSETAVHWDRFRKMTQSGLEMGMTGYSYSNLSSMSHIAQRGEMSRSHRIISDRTGFNPKVASFPFGTFDATTISCCRELGLNFGIGFSGLFQIGGKSGLLAPSIDLAKLSLKSLASALTFNYKKPRQPENNQHDHASLRNLPTGMK